MEKRYFTVSVPCSIGGAKYRQGVCYELSAQLESAVEALQEKGRAVIYDHKIRLISGKAVAVDKAAVSVQAALGSDEETAVPSSTESAEGQSVQTVQDTVKTSRSKSRSKKSGIKF